MATSGSFNTSTSGGGYSGRYHKFEWWRTSYNIEENYSDISWKVTAYGRSPEASWYSTYNISTTVNGTNTWTGYKELVKPEEVIATGTRRIYHDDDGAKTFSASTSANIGSNSGNYISGSANFVLDPIPRQPMVYIKASNVWKKGKMYVKINGVWKKAKKLFIKVGGAWKESPLKG